MIDVRNIRKTHFIGIGGIGVSAIARMMLLEGKEVSGSDRDESMITRELKSLGAHIYTGHRGGNLKNADFVIYSVAIPESNVERKKARMLNIPTLSYPEFLGELSRDKYTIAICGTHGKTTTTAMIAQILIDAGYDPTVIVGSLLKNYKSNFIAGKSKYLVVEACEYRRSFLNLHPDVIAITNIDNDHLDYYRDIDDIKNAFSEFRNCLKRGGRVIEIQNAKSSPRYRAGEAGKMLASLSRRRSGQKNSAKFKIKLKVPGEHNKENALLALRVAKFLGIKEGKAVRSLQNFEGTWRRFEFKGKTKDGALVYDDYGHHPTEIRATLAGARELFKKNRIIAVFQPHLYSRTKLLLNDFSRAFRDADEVIVTDIYAAREPYDRTIHARHLVDLLKKTHPCARYMKDRNYIVKYLLNTSHHGEVICMIGAGDINNVSASLCV